MYHVPTYLQIVDELAADIAAGRLHAGDRLAPQREFAAKQGIAASTAERVYAELIRRGLAVGEVGRGTFVRYIPRKADWGEPGDRRALVDLQFNFPILADQHALLAASMSRLASPEVLARAQRPVVADGTAVLRELAPPFLSRAGWQPRPQDLLFTGMGKQAIAAAIAALVPPGGRLGVEEFTYLSVKQIAARLGVRLVPLPVDSDGVEPRGLRAAHRAGRLDAVYLQPTLHNPLGMTMPASRREQIAAALSDLRLPAIEDAVYAFLRDDPPLAAFAPERTVFIDSLSKRIAPGITVGFVAAPAGLKDSLAAAIGSGAWLAARIALEAAACWLSDGTALRIAAAKRADAASRQEVAARQLAGFDVSADPASYHCWWRLPEPWRADTFVAAAARRGIAVTPAASFAVGQRDARSAVRLALASPPAALLPGALATLAGLARSAPEDALSD